MFFGRALDVIDEIDAIVRRDNVPGIAPCRAGHHVSEQRSPVYRSIASPQLKSMLAIVRGEIDIAVQHGEFLGGGIDGIEDAIGKREGASGRAVGSPQLMIATDVKQDSVD